MVNKKCPNRHEYFVLRLRELGMYDDDSDYEGMVGRSIEHLSSVLANQGHSGMSASITLQLFMQLMQEWDGGL